MDQIWLKRRPLWWNILEYLGKTIKLFANSWIGSTGDARNPASLEEYGFGCFEVANIITQLSDRMFFEFI